ncbi:Ger(x)C family spore germination protein [Cohnella panacarvi]|uniref:Ger(x)C family spore germination protein n=1 Tax=Cohnella panacarvi TaxID=400776 RepID=UPI000478F671|nr:Ger(x)C family spore germination protein [Cohnella panacarvi]
MNRRIWTSFILTALLTLTGCWDRAELPEKGFVMGIAIDKADDGKVAITTQIYRPSQGVSAGARKAKTAYINISTVNQTLSRAIRDIPIILGRKAQWSHIHLIVVGEQLARESHILDTLEFFYRDHEPRLTVSVMIGQGKAEQYLKSQPLIENTTSQQLFQSAEKVSTWGGKTLFANLLTMGLQLESELGNAVIPYVYFSEDTPKVIKVSGVALLRKGKLVGRMEPLLVEGLQMLTNDFENGMLEIACSGPSKNSRKKTEAVEVGTLKSTTKPVAFSENSMRYRISVSLDVSVVELGCNEIKTIQDERKFASLLEERVKELLEETLDWLQLKKFDALGLGNRLYRTNPRLWKKWKSDWDDRFARAKFDIVVKVRNNSSGTTIGKPVSK